MTLPFYDAIHASLPATPNDYYRNHFQALINAKWTETTTRFMIKAETGVGTFEFEDVEVKLNHAIEKSTGTKQGDDFREIIFQDIDHDAPRGLYYFFDGCYWLTINTDEYNRISKNVMVRRCNNWFKYRNPDTGAIVQVPCVMEYDTASPTPQVDNDVITPNNHAILIVQGNERTLPFTKANMRFLWGERPFKITGYNNYLQLTVDDPSVPLLYIDAYLDEISPYDDFENGVAYNFDAEYSIKINQTSFEQIQGYQTALTATVYNQDEIIQRDLIWSTSDNTIVTVDDTGLITLVGNVGQTATITVSLKDNNLVSDTITIAIVEQLSVQAEIVVTPLIQELAQGRTVVLQASLVENNVPQDILVDIIPSGANLDTYSVVDLGHNMFQIKCLKVSQIPLILTFRVDKLSTVVPINLVSMF